MCSALAYLRISRSTPRNHARNFRIVGGCVRENELLQWLEGAPHLLSLSRRPSSVRCHQHVTPRKHAVVVTRCGRNTDIYSRLTACLPCCDIPSSPILKDCATGGHFLQQCRYASVLGCTQPLSHFFFSLTTCDKAANHSRLLGRVSSVIV